MNRGYLGWLLVIVTMAFLYCRGMLAEDEVELRWNINRTDCFEYAVSTLQLENGVVRSATATRKVVLFFGHELSSEGMVKLEPKTFHDVAYHLSLMVPGTRQKIGYSWDYERLIKTLPGLEPMLVKGRCTLTRKENVDKTPCVVIKGEFDFYPAAGGKGAEYWKVAGGKLNFFSFFAEADGVLKRAEIFMRVEQEPARKSPEIAPWNLVVNERLDLKVVTSSYTAAFLDRVHGAIASGVEYLKSVQAPDGSWGIEYKQSYPMGPTALVLLALMNSGVPADDPAVVRGFEYLKKLPFRKTYSVSLLLMAIEAKYIPFDEHKGRPDNLEETTVTKHIRKHISKEDSKWARDATKWLLENSVNEAVWSYPVEGASSAYDHSNTQYAILGLKSAWRCGVHIPTTVWRKVLRHFIKAQAEDGDEVRLDVVNRKDVCRTRTRGAVKAKARGWSYTRTSNPTGSMTCAGISSIAIARSGLLEKGDLTVTMSNDCNMAIRDGLAWMQKNFSVRENPPYGGWFHYYLYGMERAFVLAGVEEIGGHDWYREGAIMLITTQEDNGRWVSEIETSFALLFLRRATIPVRTD